jgi:uncharacterized protein (TIGR02611 family)
VPPPSPGRARPTADQRREYFAHDGHHSLRERVAESRWRRRVAARRSLDSCYRLAVGIVGGLVVAVGLVTIPLPGPGWLTVIAGLFVLATEFMWAERLLHFTKRNVRAWTEWLGRQPVWVRLGVGVLTAVFVYAAVVVVLHVMGVPDWVPGWVPLWR